MSEKSIEDYFDVAHLESHGPNHAEDNPRKQVHVWRWINKNFARNLLLADDVVFFFSDKFLQKRRLALCW